MLQTTDNIITTDDTTATRVRRLSDGMVRSAFTIVPPATEADFEEVPADTPDATGPAAYKARLVALIRERYDSDDETALLRQRDTKPEEFAEYNAYVERCKTIAREAVTVNPAEDGDAAAD